MQTIFKFTTAARTAFLCAYRVQSAYRLPVKAGLFNAAITGVYRIFQYAPLFIVSTVYCIAPPKFSKRTIGSIAVQVGTH
jgi:hypothetical protein